MPERPPQVSTLDVVAAMRQSEAATPPSDEQLSRGGFFEVEERAVPGPEGKPDVSLPTCPPAAPKTAGPRPVLHCAHGGAMVIGNNPTGVDLVPDWTRDLDAAAAPAEHRRTPQHPYPAPVENAHTGLVWTAEHAGEFCGAPDRIPVARTSAGDGPTAAAALPARDRKGPRPIGQVPMTPILDDRNNTLSARQITDRGVRDRLSNETARTAPLGEPHGGPDVPAYTAPAHVEDLSAPPPASIDDGSTETSRDKANAYTPQISATASLAELHI
ncbi:alpha/beta hydrolase [Streptomyces sp. NPDC001980]|uniref:alpha/beta hydrolase n=1 Tax=Streptomyces sp. NPDC001980 TaxID=3157126 RepID=UPI003330C35D